MHLTLNPSTFFLVTSNTKHTTINQNSKNRKQKHIHKNKKPNHPFPKSAPTPLLIHSNPHSQTKLEALNIVIDQLESSLRKHITIEPQIFASLLETCYHLHALEQGSRIHNIIPKNLLRKNVGIVSKLMRLYATCGRIEDAHKLFDEMPKRNDSAFPWNSLISGYAELALYEDAIAIYFQMEEEGVEPDRFTFPRVLKACSGIGSVRVGEEIHRHVIRKGFLEDEFVQNSLIDMYAKCGDIVMAQKVFDKMTVRDIICYNSMITGYIRHGLLSEALNIYRLMVQNGYDLDQIGVSAILTATSSLKTGSQVHAWVIRRGTEWDLSVANALIIFYANQGKLKQARWVFDEMPERDIVSWNSIISAHCKDPQALIYFCKMEKAGAFPDKVTFVSLLSVCAHLGLVEEGERLLSSMREKYEISPIMEHYACIVNMYGKAGLIDKAYDVIVNKMEFEAGPTVWGALLYACFLHGNVSIGEVAAHILFELEPDNEHNFELLIKIYSDKGKLGDVERVRLMMVERGLAK